MPTDYSCLGRWTGGLVGMRPGGQEDRWAGRQVGRCTG